MTLVGRASHLKIMMFIFKALVFPGLFLLSSCDSHKEEQIVGHTMGTTFSIKYIANSDSPKRELLSKEVKDLLFEVNRQMSTYMFESEISTVNRANEDIEIPISSDFAYVLSFSLKLAELTDGVYDPTIGPLVNLWGFGPKGQRVVPKEEQILETKKFVGYKLVELRSQKIRKRNRKVYLDLSSSAKGFGVDKVSNYLESKGILNYMVEIGGEIRTRGSKKGKKPWMIAIEAPSGKGAHSVQKAFAFSNLSIATSGSYRNYFQKAGKVFSHTINYKTGKPIEHQLASVSVVSKDGCMQADAYATALMAMGPIEGFEFAKSHGIAAYFIFKLDHESQFKVKTTEAFERVLTEKKKK